MTTGVSGLNKQASILKNTGFGGVNDATIAKNAKLIESTLNLVDQAVNLASKALDQLGQLDKMSKPAEQQQGIVAGGCFPTEPPNPLDSVRDANSLKVDKDGKITTPGGYVIEQLGQFEWKVTGPDGKNTRVWGDPHVDEGDGGKFDFKRDTAFVLGDGTHINVTCKPYGNGMTVTGQLDIVAGDSHVRVTDIDKGKGKVGQPTQDGLDEVVRFHSNSKTDILRMGKETDDWTFEGKEIIGSENGGEKFKTGNDPVITNHTIAAPYAGPKGPTSGTQTGGTQAGKNDPLAALRERFDAITRLFDSLNNTRANGFNPFRAQDDLTGYDRNQHRDGMKAAFDSVTKMLETLQQLSKLSDMVGPRRQTFF